MTKLVKHTLQIEYGNVLAQILLWQKAILLVPLWAICLIPLIGLVCRSFGPIAIQLGHGLIMALAAAYLFEDILKRKIRLDDDYIYFGYRVFPIKDIVGIDVIYNKRNVLPSKLVISFVSGKSLKLSINGMTGESIEKLVRYLQSRNSNLKTAPVLSTLVKCKRVTRKPAITTTETLAVGYHNKQFLEESIEAFRASALQWVRIGPLVAVVIMGPLWMSAISALYLCLEPNAVFSLQSINTHQFLGQLFDGLQAALTEGIRKMSASMLHFADLPVVAIATSTSIFAIFSAVLYRCVLQPNLLLADRQGMRLVLRFGELSIPFVNVDWSSLVSAQLHKPEDRRGLQSWTMRLVESNGKTTDISLASVSPEDRAKVLKRLESEAPGCKIESDLAQSMLPKSEHSYTELWLQSLTQTPERKTMEPLEPAQVIGDGRFEVVNAIGVGGQGTAYLCRTTDGAAATVVLKEMILPVFVEQSIRRTALEKFEHEARMLQAISDPRIVNLIDYFIEDHRSYLVLEHIDGMSLREMVLRQGPMGEDEVRSIAAQMCEILRVLHSQGIVHRDFTPDNLILSASGMLKLIDFNVAQQMQTGSTGTIVGKHAYLPPEQFRGKATTQSDLYAMGCTMHFLLTGSDPEPISQSSPAALRPNIDPVLDQLVRKATALQLDKRYQSFEQIEQDLSTSSEYVSVKLEQEEEVVVRG